MGVITVVNNSSVDIHVSVTATGGDFKKGGAEEWFTLKARGGSDSWGRSEKQVVRFVRSLTPGVLVETILGVPDQTVNIY